MADNNKKSNFSSLSQGEGRGEALITGAEALMRSLEHQGVKTIFGYPGGSIMPVFDALYDHRKELNISWFAMNKEPPMRRKALHVCRARLAFVWLPVDQVLPILSRALQMP